MSFKKLKSILHRNGYGKITDGLTQIQMIDMIKEEILNEGLDISKTYEENQQVIYNSFYDNNWVSIYCVFSPK